MPDLLWSLIVAAVAGGVLALVFWPESGLFWRLQRTRQMTERVLIEDALKHLYEEQIEGRRSTCGSLAAALHISEGQADALLTQTAERQLAGAELRLDLPDRCRDRICPAHPPGTPPVGALPGRRDGLSCGRVAPTRTSAIAPAFAL